MTPEQRLTAFRDFVEKRPGDPFARYSLAMQLRSMGRAAEAAAELRQLAQRSPDYVPAYIILGKVLEGLGETAEAARIYEAGIAVASRAQDDHARSELGSALASLQVHGEAR
ncbi:MAG TPA: tetratricopeptide repeat protein [Anaeromyxobacteraceae bacterium]|nr:tetratricopeptide repeat protein [Anaeromyxobacteraceae bacterium]